ncbi:PLP2 [Brettanomyces bruxellensis]|uniref:DEBR0S6_04324g1_1 n=1 Tax=Dekkera bruxellensis TaxID=5007 RepID=A0A7D9CZY2_DEKBR|nr:PLP2 [Brettanomyces bruxellensis]
MIDHTDLEKTFLLKVRPDQLFSITCLVRQKIMNPGYDPKIQVEVDPTEDTEWNDILREHGIIPEKPRKTEELEEEAREEKKEQQHANRLENKTLNELDELEDDEEEEFLEKYKQKRMAEIRRLASKAHFGEVYGISKPEYKKEVTEASKHCFVVVHMSLHSSLQSRILANLLNLLAHKYPQIKFVDIPASRAVENYPETSCPTLLIYKGGDVIKQYVTLLRLAGNQTKISNIEDILVEVKAIKDTDRRLVKNNEPHDEHSNIGEHQLSNEVGEDEDDFLINRFII